MKPTIRDVEYAVCQHFKLTTDILRGPIRSRRYARPRQIAMFLALDMTGWGTSAVGRYFHRDHSTAGHARVRIPELCATRPKLADNLRACREAVEAICRERAMIVQPWKAPLCSAPETSRRVFVACQERRNKRPPVNIAAE